MAAVTSGATLLQHEQSSQDPAADGCSVVQPVSLDAMVFLAERLLEAQEQFRTEGAAQGRPCSIDIGYHYTKPENLDHIQTDGLLNRADRDSRQILSSSNGARYGEGIYTGSDPQSFSDYGPVGLMVLRLKGVEMDADEAGKGYSKGNNSITSLKRPGLVVLEKSEQCLPVIQFLTDDLSTNQRGLAHLSYLERRIQSLLVEHFQGRRTTENTNGGGTRKRGKTKHSRGGCCPLSRRDVVVVNYVYSAVPAQRHESFDIGRRTLLFCGWSSEVPQRRMLHLLVQAQSYVFEQVETRLPRQQQPSAERGEGGATEDLRTRVSRTVCTEHPRPVDSLPPLPTSPEGGTRDDAVGEYDNLP
jgi:hypothetical protein